MTKIISFNFFVDMVFLKINGLVLSKEKIKESDASLYILTKNQGMLKCYLRGVFRSQSKNLGLMEPGNFNRFFILTDFQNFKIISALPLKIPTKIFKKEPYRFLWTLKLIKNLKLLETPNFIWFVLNHLEDYLNQNSKNFSFWFLYHLLKELGYGIDLDHCQNCKRKLKTFAFFDNKRFLYCFYCKKQGYQKIIKEELLQVKKIKSLIKIPKILPKFLKKMIKENFLAFQKKII